MNRIREHFLTTAGRPGLYLVAALVTATVLMGAAPLSQEGKEEEKVTLSVIPLRYAAARQVAAVIENTIHARITVDERTNALIVGGSEEAMVSIREIVAQLDVAIEEPKGSDEELVRVYPLVHAVADPQLAATLDSLFDSTRSVRRSGRILSVKPVRIAYDAHTNQIIARGTTLAIASLNELIEAIDRAPTEARGPAELRVRLVWLVGGLGGQHGTKVPPDMGQVLNELGKIGISDLRLAAQTIVRVTGNDVFKTQFVARLDQLWRMSFSGRAISGPEGARTIEVDIRGQDDADIGDIRLETTITTVSDHFVVLGATPIQDLQSVFVIQLTDLE
ncbi:MAG: secretin N-terminal domain-containing protein [Planctomycetota bacterium]|jgi:hypothetical protein